MVRDYPQLTGFPGGRSVTQVVFFVENESVQHFFFECPTTSGLWQQILRHVQVYRAAEGFEQEVRHAIRVGRSNSSRCRLYFMLLAETVYQVWGARNRLIFQQQAF